MTREEIIELIDANVYENHNKEITGEGLNTVLKAIVSSCSGQKVYVDIPMPEETVVVDGTLAECAAAAGISEQDFVDIATMKIPFIRLSRDQQNPGVVYQILGGGFGWGEGYYGAEFFGEVGEAGVGAYFGMPASWQSDPDIWHYVFYYNET